MVDRIKKIMEYYELSPASLAEQIGINRSNLTHLFSGRNQPSLELAKKILHCYPDIKTEWLIMGVGEMFRNNEERELAIKVLNEKKLKKEMAEQDLFSTIQNPVKLTVNTLPEQPVVIKSAPNDEIYDSKQVDGSKIDPPTPTNQNAISHHQEKETAPPQDPRSEVAKIVFFYTDGSFEMFVGR